MRLKSWKKTEKGSQWAEIELQTAQSSAMGLPGMRTAACLPGDPLKPGVDVGAQIPMEDRDTKGVLYEYMLGNIASTGLLLFGICTFKKVKNYS